MFAVISTGGKQYLVEEGQELKVEKLSQDNGSTIEFDVLMVGENDGSKVQIGTPIVKGAKVKATVVETGKGDKVSVIKFKRKVRYRRNVGHRQPFTKIKIEKIAV